MGRRINHCQFIQQALKIVEKCGLIHHDGQPFHNQIICAVVEFEE